MGLFSVGTYVVVIFMYYEFKVTDFNTNFRRTLRHRKCIYVLHSYVRSLLVGGSVRVNERE